MSLPAAPEEILSQFLATSSCVIADTFQGARTRLAGSLVELGAKISKISLCATFEDARNEIREKKAKVVLTDFNLGKHSGLDLVHDLRQNFQNDFNSQETLFILISSNSSQAAVAKAAEEDVDSFILKPYTTQLFIDSLQSAVIAKLYPSEYVQLIQKGKAQLFQGKAPEALDYFEKAIPLNRHPSLALFYKGQALKMKKILEQAHASYQEGLHFNQIHYKCLVGLFDTLLDQGKKQEAYEVVRKISQYFPSNPNRLKMIVRLVVETSRYEDLEEYYSIFTQLDERSDELVRHICAALIVGGKYFIRNDSYDKAVSFLEKVCISCAGRSRFIRWAIQALDQPHSISDAKRLLPHFPPEEQSGPDYLISEYLIECRIKGPNKMIQKGLQLLQQGIQSETIYRLLLEGYALAGQKTAAEDLYLKAVKLFPDERSRFEELYHQFIKN